MDDIDPNLSTENLEKQQEQRTFLRERFLRAMNGLVNKSIQIQMYGETRVNADFGSADIEFQKIHVCNLATPMGVLPNALLRTTDIISLNVELSS
ncbi:gem-associated protein 7-like [Tubulanus polymorphus]|uniref:gem-associated protein 7-like n=1 Tax=Tubulanus polymorphus TaxID=672921 RepID=UPI003DA5D8D2